LAAVARSIAFLSFSSIHLSVGSVTIASSAVMSGVPVVSSMGGLNSSRCLSANFVALNTLLIRRLPSVSDFSS